VDWALAAPATSPPARWSQGMAYDFARAQVVMFGGASGGVTALGDTWSWDGSTWTPLPGTQPPAATRTALAYDYQQQATVQFGGHLSLGQTWLFDGTSWRRDPRAFAPAGRESFTMADDLVRQRIVLFGGGTSNDTWEYTTGDIARWTAFGSGCAGTAGTPVLRPAAGSLPVLGRPFPLELAGLPPSGLAAVSIGFSDAQWNGQPLPLSLSALGMPGCSLFASPDFLFVLAISAGGASLAWPLPASPGLAGTTFVDQGFVLDPGSNALGAIVANAGR